MTKSISIIFTTFLLSGCLSTVTTTEQMYYEATRSISRDNTMSQTACWAAITEIAKSGDQGSKTSAIFLAEKCKNNAVTLEPPKRNILGF
jgi:hypothetical protein